MPEVFVTRNGTELTVSNPQVHLEAGDWVVWRFPDLSLRELAFIHFYSPEDKPFGPFQSLEPSSFHVRGLGNTGDVREYFYTAFILNEEGVVARSRESASVHNFSTQVDTSPYATVHFHEGTLHIAPSPLKVEIGRTAFWYVTGLPEGHFVTIRFEGFDDEMVGPFSTFSMSRAFGDAWLATGTNYTGPVSGPQNGQVQYQVSLRRPDGFVMDIKDPVIEPPGWPPGSPELP